MNNRGRQAAAFAQMDEEEDTQQQEILRLERMNRMMNGGNEEYAEFGDGNDPNDLGNVNDYSEAQGPISAWISRKEVHQFIRRKFARFLRNY
jgi:DNA replication licensing factor MCM2